LTVPVFDGNIDENVYIVWSGRESDDALRSVVLINATPFDSRGALAEDDYAECSTTR